jgi:hypothetical protein
VAGARETYDAMAEDYLAEQLGLRALQTPVAGRC